MKTEKYFEKRRVDRIAFIDFKPISGNLADIEEMHYTFAEYCDEIESDDEIRVCVIKCTCLNICSVFDTSTGFRQWQQSTSLVPSIVESVAKLTLPVIICMHGEIKGLILELALACDVRLATTESQFAFNHIESGLIPHEGGTQRLPRIIGIGNALEMLLTGDAIDAGKALSDGLIHRILAKDAINSAADELARQMGAKSPLAMMYAKEAIAKGLDLTLDQGLRLEADLYFLLHSTEDRIEGISAYNEKRKPSFKGQ